MTTNGVQHQINLSSEAKIIQDDADVLQRFLTHAELKFDLSSFFIPSPKNFRNFYQKNRRRPDNYSAGILKGYTFENYVNFFLILEKKKKSGIHWIISSQQLAIKRKTHLPPLKDALIIKNNAGTILVRRNQFAIMEYDGIININNHIYIVEYKTTNSSKLIEKQVSRLQRIQAILGKKIHLILIVPKRIFQNEKFRTLKIGNHKSILPIIHTSQFEDRFPSIIEHTPSILTHSQIYNSKQIDLPKLFPRPINFTNSEKIAISYFFNLNLSKEKLFNNSLIHWSRVHKIAIGQLSHDEGLQELFSPQSKARSLYKLIPTVVYINCDISSFRLSVVFCERSDPRRHNVKHTMKMDVNSGYFSRYKPSLGQEAFHFIYSELYSKSTPPLLTRTDLNLIIRRLQELNLEDSQPLYTTDEIERAKIIGQKNKKIYALVDPQIRKLKGKHRSNPRKHRSKSKSKRYPKKNLQKKHKRKKKRSNLTSN